MSIRWADLKRQREEQNLQPNNAGGYTHRTDKWTQLKRFLILGSEGGTYYVGQQKLTQQNATNVLACIKEDGSRVIQEIASISTAGRAPKNDPALFALAMVFTYGDPQAKTKAEAAFPDVVRIGTHLFHFAQFAQQFRGWGRLLRRTVRNWYLKKPPNDVAFQMVKYQQRDGWAHRDLLRLSHPKAFNKDFNRILQWAVGKLEINDKTDLPEIIMGANQLKQITDPDQAALTISSFNLPREAVPTELLNSPLVWDALLENMPMEAMVRNLAKMTAVGLLQPFSDHTKLVCYRLRSLEFIAKSKIHPIKLLAALKTYSQGHGEKGKLKWTPVSSIIEALDDGFRLAFGNVRPSGKNTLIGLDISPSMFGAEIQGIPGLNAAVASAAMCLITVATEPATQIMGFASRPSRISFTSKTTLNEALKETELLSRYYGGTDCSLPFTMATQGGWPVENFIVYTDSESWQHRIQPSQALRDFRQQTGINATLAVVGMTSTDITIADPNDPGMMDVAGFDTATPDLISSFAKGEF